MNVIFIIIVLLFFISFLPLRFHFEIKHRQQWTSELTISLLWFKRIIFLPDSSASSEMHDMFELFEEQVVHIMEDGELEIDLLEKPANAIVSRLQDRWRRTSFQVEWHGAWVYAKKVLNIINRHSVVEEYQLQCCIGCSRPDCTAYLYGAFWTALSALPQNWLEQGSITYLPDFQQKRQDVLLQGIIRCRMGQLINIIVSVFWLTVASIWKQRREEQQKQKRSTIRQFGEEQMIYES